jgi:hypothetical protein
MGLWSKFATGLRIILGLFALLVVWIGFQLGTHRHTGILRTLAEAKQFLSQASSSPGVGQHSAISGPQHSVSLSWKPSSSVVVGYNVYRRGASGLVRLNIAPVAGTSYVDRTVQLGQTYFYVTKALNAKGSESTASNEVRVDIPPK